MSIKINDNHHPIEFLPFFFIHYFILNNSISSEFVRFSCSLQRNLAYNRLRHNVQHPWHSWTLFSSSNSISMGKISFTKAISSESDAGLEGEAHSQAPGGGEECPEAQQKSSFQFDTESCRFCEYCMFPPSAQNMRTVCDLELCLESSYNNNQSYSISRE